MNITLTAEQLQTMITQIVIDAVKNLATKQDIKRVEEKVDKVDETVSAIFSTFDEHHTILKHRVEKVEKQLKMS